MAIATFPKTAITGTRKMEVPKSKTISGNSMVLFPKVVLKGGGLNSGSPGRTVPVRRNGDPPYFVSETYAIAEHVITTNAFLEVDTNHSKRERVCSVPVGFMLFDIFRSLSF